MTDLEKFRDFLFNEYNIINPLLTFDGDYILGDCDFKNPKYDKNKDMLYLNSNIDKDGNNMYEKLIERKAYYNFEDERFNSLKRDYFYPMLVNRMNKDGKGRHIEFSFVLTMMNLMEDKRVIRENNDEEKMPYACHQYYKQVKKDFSSIIRGENNEEAYNRIRDRFIAMKRPINEQTLRSYSDVISNIIYLYRCFEDFVNNPIIIKEKELTSCYDPDKFILMYCKMVLDNQKETLTKQVKLDTSFVIVSQVITTLNEVKLKGYNPTIKVYDRNTKKLIIYSFRDLIKDYNRLSSKYSDTITSRQMQLDQVERMNLFHDNDAFNKFAELFNEEDQKIINTEFDILAKGEGETHTTQVRNTNRKSNSVKKDITDDEILYRRFIFENTNYVCQIVGRDKFNGYVGYIYENGLVIFERFYEEDGTTAKQNATYIMNYQNFVEFIQLTKVEILECIKDGRDDIKRLYHTKNWANNLSSYITSIEENMDSVAFAHTLSKEKIRK